MCPVSEEDREGVGSFGTGGIDGCELPFECWELKPALLKEHLVFLTAELSPAPEESCFNAGLLEG